MECRRSLSPPPKEEEEEEGNGPPSPSMNQEENLRSSGHKKVVKYKECLKNHAAAIGGNATDGCGEFMPGGEEGSLEALKCSACNCHRNFHRKEIDCDWPAAPFGSYHPALLNAATGGRKLILGSPPPPHHHHNYIYPATATAAGTLISSKVEGGHDHQQQIIMSYRGGGGGSVPSETDEKDNGRGGGKKVVRKRFRTKFTAEQKEKMLKFAEKAGWRIQKVDETVVQQFCHEVGIKRRVLKVWMHNNKQTFANKLN